MPVLFGIRPTDTARVSVGAATGVTAEVFDAMHLSAFHGRVLNLGDIGAGDKASLQRVRQREWALFHTSRACPDCLAESGGVWQLWWRLGAAAVCPVHRLMLLTACPGCGMELRQGSVKREVVLSRRQRVDPTRCGNRVTGRLCLYPLVGLPRIAVGHELCAAQIAYLDAAGGRPPPVAGHRVGAVEWGEAFKVVCGLARFAGRNVELPSAVPVPAAAVEAFVADARQHELTPMGSAGGYRSMPRTAALAAALLAFTGDILAADSPDGLREALRPLGRAILVPHPLTRRERPRSWPMPAFLHQALLSVFPVPEASRTRVPADVPAAAGGVGRPMGGGLEFRHVPQVVAIDDYQELIAAWLRTRSALAGRRFAALALARVCGASSWESAGAELQWHDGRAQSVAEQVSRFVVDPRRFWRAIAVLAARLWQRGPIDYDSRRQVLSTLGTVDAAVWAPVFVQHGLELTSTGCRASAVWLWAALTCGEVRDAPGFAHPDWSAVSGKGRLQACRRLSNRLPTALAAELLAFGQAILDSHTVR